jgi:hypothetical protein
MKRFAAPDLSGLHTYHDAKAAEQPQPEKVPLDHFPWLRRLADL